MPCFTRSLLRWGLIGALALGGATLIFGPDMIATGFAQARQSASSLMDRFVDDPIALRRQLATLGEAYPDRIAEVRGELAAVDRQIQQLQQDSEVAQRVVANTSADLDELRGLLAEAEQAAAGRSVPVSIRTRGVRLDLDEARGEVRRVSDIRIAYQDRAAGNAHQLRFLSEQKGRLVEILGRLEAEYGDFEVKLGQIDRQIDAIERNERLIEMTKQQRAILAEYEKFGTIGNLPQLEARLAELQAVQEAQLETLAKVGVDRNYEREARRQLQNETEQDETGRDADTRDGAEPARMGPPAPRSTVDRGSVAFIEPIIIESR
jgi:phage shock protein A